MEEEAEAKRARRQREQAFMRMLAATTPAMQVGTSFAQVEALHGQDPRFLVSDGV